MDRLLPRNRCGLDSLARRRKATPNQVSIGNALAYNRSEHIHKATAVISAPIVESVHLFVNIAEQVKGVNADVGAFNRPLEQAPEILQAVRVDLTAHVLPGVVDHLMLIELGKLALAVLLGGVGVEIRALLNASPRIAAHIRGTSRCAES